MGHVAEAHRTGWSAWRGGSVVGRMGKGGAGPGLSDGAKSWREGHAVGHLGAGHGAGARSHGKG